MTIEINALRLYCHHGVMEQERTIGNWFEVSASLNLPVIPGNDDIKSTLNYAEVIDIIKEVMKQPAQLLETVASNIKGALTARFPDISGGCVKVSKLQPPISNLEIGYVAVKLEW